MKLFSISCYDKEKNLVGQQTISMSSNDYDLHKISFVGKNNSTPFVIDVENHELILDNSNGDFDEITTDKPIAKIKVSNIHLDYDQNITFRLDDSSTSYRIAGNAFERKKGATYEPIKTYEDIFDIVLPSTLFADMQASNLHINGFPFQMFEALTEQDKSDFGIETYQSSNKLLNIIKYKDQVFIARGKKFVPVSLDHQNYYKIGNDSVFGFTLGRNNGVVGKQSQGVAFKMTEAELEDVAKFLNGGLDNITFKTQEDLLTNDIDYRRINRQSDLDKVMNITPPTGEIGDYPTPPPSEDPGNNSRIIPDPEPQTPTEDPVEPQPQPDDKPVDDTPPSKPKPAEPKPTGNDKGDKKEEKPSKPAEKVTADLGYLSTALALISGCLLVAGALFGPIAWFFFGLFALSAITNFTISGSIASSGRHRRTKQEKINNKLNKKQKQISKLQTKTPTKRRLAKIQRLQNGVNKLQTKLTPNGQAESTVDTPTTPTNGDTPTAETPTTATPEVTPSTTETRIDSEMASPTTETPIRHSITADERTTIHSALDNVLKNKPTNASERDGVISTINDYVANICPDGADISTIDDADKDFFQNCINYRVAYMSEMSAKQTLDQATASGDAEAMLVADEAYTQAKERVNIELNNLYNSSNAPTVEPVVQEMESPDTGRTK